MSTDFVVISMLVVFFVIGPIVFVIALCRMAARGDEACPYDWETEL